MLLKVSLRSHLTLCLVRAVTAVVPNCHRTSIVRFFLGTNLTVDHAKIVEFDESNPVQDPIDDSTVWYRSSVVPGSGSSATSSNKKRKRASVNMSRRKNEKGYVIRVSWQHIGGYLL